MSHITIYSTPTCQYCKKAKEFFTQHGVRYQEKDVTSDPEISREMFEKTKQMGVPVIVMKHHKKEAVIVGFQKSLLEKILKL